MLAKTSGKNEKVISLALAVLLSFHKIPAELNCFNDGSKVWIQGGRPESHGFGYSHRCVTAEVEEEVRVPRLWAG